MSLEEIKSYLNEIRRDFSNQPLDEQSVADNPFDQYAIWFEEAVNSQLLDPYAMCLSTAGHNGQPTSRIVYLRDIGEEGFVFYTNYTSRKAKDLEENPRASLNFLWRELDRQIRVEGLVSRSSAELSDKYFASRPRESQIGAWASSQSSRLQGREELMQEFEEIRKRFSGEVVPRPPFWGGFVLKPEKVEFWQGRPNRLHDRIVYVREGSAWTVHRLAP